MASYCRIIAGPETTTPASDIAALDEMRLLPFAVVKNELLAGDCIQAPDTACDLLALEAWLRCFADSDQAKIAHLDACPDVGVAVDLLVFPLEGSNERTVVAVRGAHHRGRL